MADGDTDEKIRHHDHLSRAYGLESAEQTNAFYSDWAATYDAELEVAGYATPDRCAKALMQHAASPDIRILDIGCGTGLSGAALKHAGFTNVSGSEINPDMLAHAKERGVYGNLWLADPQDPFPFEAGDYDAITAIGVIGTGAAPLGVLEDALVKLGSSGLCCFSFNDHTLEDPSFEGMVMRIVDCGVYSLLFKEYGPHLPAKSIRSNVYVLKRM